MTWKTIQLHTVFVQKTVKEANHDGDFGITLAELWGLRELRSYKKDRKLWRCLRNLKTSPSEGLSENPADLERREAVLEKNFISPKKPKTFL